MNEFNIIKYLYDIKLIDILAFIKLPEHNNTSITKYLFQASNEENKFVTGYIDIFTNQIIIRYKENDTEHIFSSKIKLYTADNYIVKTEYSTINSKNEKKLIYKKIGRNIDKKSIFSFLPEKKKIKKKSLVYY